MAAVNWCGMMESRAFRGFGIMTSNLLRLERLVLVFPKLDFRRQIYPSSMYQRAADFRMLSDGGGGFDLLS